MAYRLEGVKAGSRGNQESLRGKRRLERVRKTRGWFTCRCCHRYSTVTFTSNGGWLLLSVQERVETDNNNDDQEGRL